MSAKDSAHSNRLDLVQFRRTLAVSLALQQLRASRSVLSMFHIFSTTLDACKILLHIKHTNLPNKRLKPPNENYCLEYNSAAIVSVFHSLVGAHLSMLMIMQTFSSLKEHMLA